MGGEEKGKGSRGGGGRRATCRAHPEYRMSLDGISGIDILVYFLLSSPKAFALHHVHRYCFVSSQ